MRKRFGRTAAAIAVAGGLLVGLSTPVHATERDHGRRHHDGGDFIRKDRDRWDHGHHNWHPRPDAGPTVIANGLNNPRQISLPVDQALLIAEAGRGGPNCQGEGEDAFCVGDTGAVSVRFLPQRNDIPTFKVVKNLFSGSGPDGSFAIGSHGASARVGGPIFIVANGEGDALVAKPFRQAEVFAKIRAYEEAHDPDGMGVDSNPYGVLALRDKVLVADAAANTVFQVNRHGEVSVFHVFPNIVNDVTTTPTDTWPGYDPTPEFPGAHFVPTSLAEGPRGEIYVGGLASELPGQGQVVRLNRWSGEVEKTWSGFMTVTGVDVGRDGSLYVSQLFAPQAAPVDPMVAGVLSQVKRDGTRTDKDVPFPAGVAVDDWNNVYVAAFSVAPDTGFEGGPPGVDTSGQIWRLRF
jgi:hypothetical protein